MSDRARLLAECKGHARFFEQWASEIRKVEGKSTSRSDDSLRIRHLLGAAAQLASDAADRYRRARP